MKKILAITTALALTAGMASAEVLTTWQPDNYVKSASQRVDGTNTWAPGLLVKAGGVKSFYFIGENGVTSDMVFSDYDAAVAWAESMTGENIRAVGKRVKSGNTQIVQVGYCPPEFVEVAMSGRDLVWR